MSRLDGDFYERKSAENRAAKIAVWGGQQSPQSAALEPRQDLLPAGGCVTVKGRAKRQNKFGAVKSAEGDSRKEVRRLQELRLLQAAGQIQSLIPQVRYGLVPAQRKGDGTIERALTYTCDAQYVENGRLVVEDCKSPPTRALPRYIAARKLMLQLYGIEIHEV